MRGVRGKPSAPGRCSTTANVGVGVGAGAGEEGLAASAGEDGLVAANGEGESVWLSVRVNPQSDVLPDHRHLPLSTDFPPSYIPYDGVNIWCNNQCE